MADGDRTPGRTESGWVPIPDPTTLTTEAVARATDIFRREITALRDLHDKDLAAFRELLDARFDVVDQDRARIWDKTDDIIKRFTDALNDFRAEVERRDVANRQLIEQRLADLDKARQLAADQIKTIPEQDREARDRLCHDFRTQLRAEREYIMGQITNALAETRRTGDVAQEKFAAVDALFASNALALAAALAAQEKAVAAQNDSNTLAITQERVQHQGDDQRQRRPGADRAVQPRRPGDRHQGPRRADRVHRRRRRRAAHRPAGQHRHDHRRGRHPRRSGQLHLARHQEVGGPWP